MASERIAKPLTDEMIRILRAIDEDRLRITPAGRYVIDGEAERPDRRSRDRLRGRGMIASRYDPDARWFVWRITAKGRQALAEATAREGS